MKKLLIIGGILVGLGIIGCIVMAFFLGNIVTAGVNNFGPRMTQTRVTLKSAAISPFSGSGTLDTLEVGNPKGWSDANLCSLGKVHIEIVPSSLFRDHIVINEISIDAPQFNYETKIVSSNVADLLKNIEQITGGGTPAGQPTAKNGKPIKFEVKKFVLKGGLVHVGVGPTGLNVPMPPLTLTDLGTREGGLTPDQFTYAVMRAIVPDIVAATTQAAGKLIPTTGAAAADALKGLFGGKKE